MARTLDTEISDGIAAAVTIPGFLIQIEIDGDTLRYSTRGTIDYDGETWVEGAEVSHIGGTSKPKLVLDNADNAISVLILSDAFIDAPVSIFAFYGEAPTAAKLLFTGVVDGADDIGLLSSTLALTDAGADRSYQPNVVLGPPLCDHFAPPGTVISWGNVTVTLETD